MRYASASHVESAIKALVPVFPASVVYLLSKVEKEATCTSVSFFAVTKLSFREGIHRIR